MHDECTDCSRRDFLTGGLCASLALFGPVRMLEAAARTDSAVSYPVPVADGVSFDKSNEVILVRWQGMVYGFALSCPHQRTALRWDKSDSRFQCPKHHSKYRPDGTFMSGRATRGMDRYSLHREGNSVVVDVSVVHKQDIDLAAWNAAELQLS